MTFRVEHQRDVVNTETGEYLIMKADTRATAQAVADWANQDPLPYPSAEVLAALIDYGRG